MKQKNPCSFANLFAALRVAAGYMAVTLVVMTAVSGLCVVPLVVNNALNGAPLIRDSVAAHRIVAVQLLAVLGLAGYWAWRDWKALVRSAATLGAACLGAGVFAWYGLWLADQVHAFFSLTDPKALFSFAPVSLLVRLGLLPVQLCLASLAALVALMLRQALLEMCAFGAQVRAAKAPGPR